MSSEPPQLPQPVTGSQLAYASRHTRLAKSGLALPVSKLRWWLTAVACVVGSTLVLGGMVGAMMSGAPFGLFYIPAALLILISIVVAVRQARAGATLSVLSYVEQAVRLNLPLPAMLKAAEGVERGRRRIIIRRLRNHLEDGAGLTESLRAAVPFMPLRIVERLAAGEYLSRLPDALGREARRQRTATLPEPSRAILTRWYPLLLVLVGSGILLGYGYFVLPKYQMIFRDFGLPIPPMMRWATEILEIANDWMASLIIGFGMIWMIGSYGGEILFPRWARESPFRRIIDWFKWRLPLVGRVERHQAMAEVCQIFADGLRAGAVLDRVVAQAIGAHVNGSLRRRLRRWEKLLIGGIPPADAAEQAGMPRDLVALMRSATPGRDLADLFEYLALRHETSQSYALHLLRSAMVPLLAMVFGAIVLMLAMSIFQPLIELIEHLGRPINRGVRL